eukprot:828971-Prymnesium_polylepis.1
MGRVALDTALNTRLLDGAEKLQNACLDLLRAYRSLCPPQAKTTNQLLLPDQLKMLPLYVLGLMKSPIFSQARACCLAAPRRDTAHPHPHRHIHTHIGTRAPGTRHTHTHTHTCALTRPCLAA